MFKGIEDVFKKTKKPAKVDPSLLEILPAESLLPGTRHDANINKIRPLLSLDDADYEMLVQPLYNRFSEFVQKVPATTTSYYAKQGGMIDHALDRTAIAVSTCRKYFLPNEEDPSSNKLTKAQALWAYAVFSASILHDIGRMFTDLDVKLFDRHGKEFGEWHAFEESMPETEAKLYKYSFKINKDPEYRRDVTKLLAVKLMPVEGMRWIMSNDNVFNLWLALLSDDTRRGGTLGLIIPWADRQAIMRYFDKFIQTKDYMHTHEPKKIADAGGMFGHPTDTDVNADIGIGNIAGIEFLRWLRSGIESGKFTFGESPLIQAPGGVLIGSDLMKLFMRENPKFQSSQGVLQSIENLHIHDVGATQKAQAAQAGTGEQSAETSKILVIPVEYIIPEKQFTTAEGMAHSAVAQEYFTKVPITTLMSTEQSYIGSNGSLVPQSEVPVQQNAPSLTSSKIPPVA